VKSLDYISQLLDLAYGAAIGAALGLTGTGGSILAVPILVYLVGQDVHMAIGTSLAIWAALPPREPSSSGTACTGRPACCSAREESSAASQARCSLPTSPAGCCCCCSPH
jgi:hypothetical protein